VMKSFTYLLLVVAGVVLFGCEERGRFPYDDQLSTDVVNGLKPNRGNIQEVRIYDRKMLRGQVLSEQEVVRYLPVATLTKPDDISRFLTVIARSTPNPRSGKILKNPDRSFQLVFEFWGHLNSTAYLSVYTYGARSYIKPFSLSGSYYENGEIIHLIQEFLERE